MRTSAVLISWVIGLCLAAACSPSFMDSREAAPVFSDAGAGTGPTPDGGTVSDAGVGGVPLDGACTLLNAGRCDYLQRCGLFAPGEDARNDCLELLSATECGPALWPARVARGTLAYHPEQAWRCAEAYSIWECGDWDKAPNACARVTSPNAPLGGKCFGGPTPECQSGVCTGGTCPRKCLEPGGSGALCEVDTDCEPDLYCKPFSFGSAVGSCTLRGKHGAPCNSNSQCADGQYCALWSACVTYASEGESCLNTECDPASWCASGPQGKFCAARFEAGAKCATDAQCAQGLLCLAETGTCEIAGPLRSEAECSHRQTCDEGLACVGTGAGSTATPELGRCSDPAPLGEPCTSTVDCAEPLTCIPGDDGGSCGLRRPDGASCAFDRDCSLSSRCFESTCTRLPRPGEPCPSGACLFGTCDASAGRPVCRGMGGPNAPCTADSHCASGRCVSGACLAACSP